MRAIWGDLSICPCLNSLELPCHTLGELQSISQLKIWGNTQEPHNDMAYLLVHTEGDSEAESYGMALVWTSPHQAQVSMMGEALGTLSAYISSGPDWLYVFAQLYKGSNHTPLPKGKHLGILSWGKVGESPHEWISQLKLALALPLMNTPPANWHSTTHSKGARVHNSATWWSAWYSNRQHTQNCLETQDHPDGRR